jgi:methylated-DNA-[protein]-cysteine S-methyltransferase
MKSESSKIIETPVGRLLLAANAVALTRCDWTDGDVETRRGPGDPLVERARRQLDEYFEGTRQTFEIPMAPSGTPFQRRVWDALARIPFGVTVTYSDVAASVGAPNAVRAVGTANGRNPLSIVVPCHRVVGRDGTLRGYAGGEPAKAWLLEHEADVLGRRDSWRAGEASLRSGA